MSKTPNYDTAIKKILDQLVPGERVCALTGEKWLMTEEEIGWYKKFNVPPSNRTPLARWKIISGFYAGYQWWWNAHAKTGAPVLTYVHPATGFKVLPDAEWFNEDFSLFARPANPQRPFFEQLAALQRAVPVLATLNLKEPQNSIALVSNGDVNSYFVLACISRESFYGVNGNGERFMEVSGARQLQDVYRVANSENIQNSRYVLASRDCLNSSFLFDCRDVSDSFFAWNRRHGKFFWFNEQLSKEEYEKRLAKVDLSSRATLKEYEKKFFDLVGSTAVWPENFNINATESSGEYLVNVQHCTNCFLCWNGACDLYWVIHGYDRAEHCAFVAGTYGSADIYESCTIADSSDCKFCFHIVQSRGMEYCLQCFNCENCFGCVGLQRKTFHIFNQSYSEEEYWKKVDEIKTAMLARWEYGHSFPLSMSFSYLPQSGPGLYFMARDEEYAALGGRMFDPESCGAIGNLALVQQTLSTNDLPDSLYQSADDLVGKSIFDPRVNRRFAFLKPEIDFYRAHNLPLPDEHFISRVQKIMATSNAGVFENRNCQICGKILRSAMNALFSERKIYCQRCYLKFLEENN